MARSTSGSRPGRSFAALLATIGLIFGLLGAGVLWSDAQWTPKLALDLEGGTQMILSPVPQEGESQKVTSEHIRRAVEIIRQRVNGSGVTEAEVTTEGDRNIVVALPGNPDEETRELVRRAAQLQFRAVLVATSGVATATTSTPTTSTGTTSPGAESPGSTSPATTSPGGDAAEPPAAENPADGAGASSSETRDNGMVLPQGVRSALAKGAPRAATTESPGGTATQTGEVTPTGTASPSPGATSGGEPGAAKDASDPTWVTEELIKELSDLNCADPANRAGGFTAPEGKPMVACSQDGSEKFILGPAEVLGTHIKTATSGLGVNSQGFSTGEWQVNLEFTAEGGRKFAEVTTRLAAIDQSDARNRFGVVLDGLVITAPTTNERIPSGEAQITGNFTERTAEALANQLKFGSLPVSFRVDTEEQISAVLGEEQLQRGLLAGLIGLVLVVIYSLLQYRALGFVTVFSLGVAAVITYGLITLLSWRQGYRLSLPGVAGLIVAIGITADSFIVFFERVRDEVRDGRPLKDAVEWAWHRARRTILISDAVSFLAAVVLYVLAVGGVRGFAFTLGLTTLVDVIVVFWFTKPMVTLLARTKFFGGGHPLSGFDPVHLGRTVRYAGRGQVRGPGDPGDEAADRLGSVGASAPGEGPGAAEPPTIAQRRAAAAHSPASAGKEN